MSTILIIDDEAQVRSLLRQAFERRGHEVLEAEHGQAGVECFRQRPIDLVITDMAMPHRGGLDTILELRRINPRVPVIAISGGNESVVVEEEGQTVWRLELLDTARRLGAQHTFWKPFDLTQMIAAVEEELIKNGTHR